MAQRAYLLIQAEMGTSTAIVEAVRRLVSPEIRVLAADTVTGPCDVIVELEGADLHRLEDAVYGRLQDIPGIKRTTTCLCLSVG